MLPLSLSLVLRQQPSADALEHLGPYFSSFLGPPRHLSLHQACAFGSTKLLDWIWDSSCTSAATRTASWSLHNYLRSDPDYYRWEFAMATEVAAKQGDVAMLEWLLTHFQDCEVPIEAAEQAAREGHVAILQLLLKYDTTSQGTQEPNVKKRKVATESGEAEAPRSGGGGHVVRWRNGRICSNSSILEDAVRNRHPEAARWIFANAPGVTDIEWNVVEAIREAMRTGDLELAEFFLPSGRTLRCFITLAELSVEMIEKLLEDGFPNLCAGHNMPTVARVGRLDLLQRLSEHYECHMPVWKKSWMNALLAACHHGHCAIVRWMIEHPPASEVRHLMERKRLLSDLLWFAAGHGSVEVMQCLQDLGAVDCYGNALVEAVARNDMNCIKWLLENFPQTERVSDYAVLDEAARRGNLKLLEFFQGLDSVPGFVSKTAKSKQGRTTRTSSGTLLYVAQGDTYRHVGDDMIDHRLSWGSTDATVAYTYAEDDRLEERSSWSSTDAMDDAAANGHLLVVQWLHEHRSEGCTTEAMDCAAANGHLEVVKWLHSNRSEGFTTKAMDGAASYGHLDVVQWLHTNTSACCTTGAMDGAARHGKLKMLKWLRSNRREGCTAKAIEGAIAHDHLGVAIWLAATYPNLTPAKFACYSDESMFDLTLFVHAHYAELIHTRGFDDKMYNLKTTDKYLRQWLRKRYPALDM